MADSAHSVDVAVPTAGNLPPRTSSPWRMGPLEAIQAASVLATVCYGASWLMAWSMLSKFQLRPEDVGLGIDFLIVRSALIGILLALTLGGLLMPTVYGNWLARGRSGDLRPFHQALAVGVTSLAAVAFTAVLIAFSYLTSDTEYEIAIGWRVVVSLLVATLLAFVEVAVILVGVGYQAGHPKGPGLSDEFKVGALVGATAIPLLLLAVGSWTAGSILAERIKADRPYSAIFNVHDVRVLQYPNSNDARREGSKPAVLACGLLLGYGDGFVRIYDPRSRRVSSFSTEGIVVEDDVHPRRGVSC